jgi:TolB-like protein
VIRSLNIWLAAWAFLAAVLLSAAGLHDSAHAQDTKRVAVLDFTGPSASAFHAQIAQGLKARSDVELVSLREVKSTAGRLGNKLSTASEIKEVGEALELSAIVDGTIVKKGRNLEATVRVRDASTGEVVHEEKWIKRRSQMKTVKPTVWTALGPAIRESSVPVKPSPKTKTKAKPMPVAEPEPDLEGEDEGIAEKEEAEEAPRKRRRAARQEEEEATDEGEEEPKPKRRSLPGDKSVQHPALVVLFGPRVMWRTLNYNGDTNLSSYTSHDQGSPAFNLALSGQWYPGAHKSNAWYSDLGLDLDSDYSIGLKSKQADKELKTTAYELGLGAIYRMQFGAFQPRLRVDYVKHVFDAKVPDTVLLPSISYSAVRLNLGTNVFLADWAVLDASFGYLPVFGTGQLSDKKYGDKVSTGAWEAGAGLLLRLREVYGLRVAVDYRRYKYDFGLADNLSGIQLPKSGTDAYLRMTLSFVYTLPGQK